MFLSVASIIYLQVTDIFDVDPGQGSRHAPADVVSKLYVLCVKKCQCYQTHTAQDSIKYQEIQKYFLIVACIESH